MALQFHHALEGMEIWSAASDGFSFVISHENRTGPGLHGSPGFTASWRPLYQNKAAIRITGSPFFKVISLGENANFFALISITRGSWAAYARCTKRAVLVPGADINSAIALAAAKTKVPINFLWFIFIPL